MNSIISSIMMLVVVVAFLFFVKSYLVKTRISGTSPLLGKAIERVIGNELSKKDRLRIVISVVWLIFVAGSGLGMILFGILPLAIYWGTLWVKRGS